MKPDPWMRLANAARQAPSGPPPDMPFGFDTRALAQWRSQREAEETIYERLDRAVRRRRLS